MVVLLLEIKKAYRRLEIPNSGVLPSADYGKGHDSK